MRVGFLDGNVVHRYKIDTKDAWLLCNLMCGGMLSQADAARFLGVSINTVYYMTQNNKIDLYIWEGRTYLSFLDVLEYGLKSQFCMVKLPIDKRVKDMHREHYARFRGIIENTKGIKNE